jgi:hypothetical protein
MLDTNLKSIAKRVDKKAIVLIMTDLATIGCACVARGQNDSIKCLIELQLASQVTLHIAKERLGDDIDPNCESYLVPSSQTMRFVILRYCL